MLGNIPGKSVGNKQPHKMYLLILYGILKINNMLRL
jgi:hypothetical protein